jgi:predicted dehydrogenase
MAFERPTSTAIDATAPEDRADAKRVDRRRFSRRKFLAIGGVAMAAGAGAYYAARRPINVGMIGVGPRGAHHARLLKWLSYVATPYGRVLAICDVDTDLANAARNAYWPNAQVSQDHRELLKNHDIEAVFVATHDLWHAEIAIDAMRAGKAVYLEKPISLSVEEAYRLRDVARETAAIVQVGTQQRSNTPFHAAWQLVNNGRLGALKRIRVTLAKPVLPTGLSIADAAPPASLDWNRWLGPAPLVPYCEFRHKGWWHLAEYAGGDLTNWGAHHLDSALWTAGLHNSFPTVVSGKGSMLKVPVGSAVPGEFTVTMEYPDGPLVELETSTENSGILFEGDRGRVFVNRARVSGKPVEALATDPLPADANQVACRRWPGPRQTTSELQHIRDFFDCILSKETPISDLGSSVCVHTALHLAGISIELDRPLRFDPGTMSIPDDSEATARTSRPRREGYTL